MGWLEEPETRNCMLLYYTGLTRVAHDILGEIVRGMFLNSTSRLSIIREIGTNAAYVAEAAQRATGKICAKPCAGAGSSTSCSTAGPTPPGASRD